MSTSAILASGSRLANFLYREGVIRSTPIKKPLQKTNPFLPWQNPHSKCWRPAKYSLRRQADLVKEARRAGVAHLIPSGLKNRPTPVELVVKERPNDVLKTSKVLLKLNALRTKQQSQELPATASKLVEVVKPVGPHSEFVAVTRHVRRMKWVGTPKERTSFGLYGKRRLMFKGHKWEKLVQRRKEAMQKVVAQVHTQKRNMRYGRFKKTKLPKTKYPI